MNPPVGDVKAQSTVARESRLTLRKTNEEVLRKALQNEARKRCHDEFKAFGDCAKGAGISVVFSCRAQSKGMSDCMDKHYSEELFEQFLREGGHPPLQPPRDTLVQQAINLVTGGAKKA